MFKSKIRRNIKLAESPSFGQHIIAVRPGSNGATDYRALARELLGLPELEPAKGEGRPRHRWQPTQSRTSRPPPGRPTCAAAKTACASCAAGRGECEPRG